MRHCVPFIILPGARAVGHGDWPVKLLSVEAGGVGRAALEHHLPAQQTVIPALVRRRPALVIGVRARHT